MEQTNLPLGPTFARLVAIYEAERLPRLRRSTQRSERAILRAAVERVGTDTPTSGDWIRYFNARLAAGELTESTVLTHRKVISRVYQFGRNFFAVVHDPLRDVPRPRLQVQRPRALRDPVRTFPQLLAAMPDYRAKAFLSLLRRHGLRRGEGLGLEPRHIDWSAGTLRIEQQRDPTSAEPRPLKSDTASATLPLHPETAELLRAAMRERMARGIDRREGAAALRYVFPYYTHATDRLIAICREVAPEDFPRRVVGVRGGDAWHVFRHTFGTELVELGLPLEKLKMFLRHRSIQTTQEYVAAIRGRVIDTQELGRAWALVAQREAAATGAAASADLVVFPLGKREDH